MKKTQFTLIEILTVIGIIAVLAAMLFPALSGARNQAKVTSAKSDMQALKSAIQQYETTYGVRPAVTDTSSHDSKISDANDPSEYDYFIELLQDHNRTDNPRGIRFLDIKNNEPGEYQDPWDNNYNVVMDYNYDEELQNGEGDLGEDVLPIEDSKILYTTVAIWSLGKDEDDDTSNPDAEVNEDNVTSWE